MIKMNDGFTSREFKYMYDESLNMITLIRKNLSAKIVVDLELELIQ
jgi:hypothetical protein